MYFSRFVFTKIICIQTVHCKNLRVVLTLLWVISVACSGVSIHPSIVSAAIWTWPQNFLLFIRMDDGSFTVAT